MRLVCPNCDAEYEVDASAIPDAGRDVQCSNCGHAWFQMSPRIEEELAAEDALFEPPPALPPKAPEEPQQIADDDLTEDAPPPTAALPRAVDESVLAVLREEAERESAARKFETPALESQQELGLTAAIAATVAAAAAPADPAPATADTDPVAQRIARMKGIDTTPAKPQTRREMLPEIDEINTTLRASSERRTGEAGAVADSLSGKSGRSSFRSGFTLMLILAVLIVALYVMSPKLAQQIPGLEPALTGYVAAVDAGRLWLDGMLKNAIGTMRGN